MAKRLALVLLAVFLVAGCSQTLNVKSIQDMSPKERANLAMKLYLQQYDDYQSLTANDAMLTDDQREVLRAKKKMLENIHPVIILYASYVNQGLEPSPEVEKQLIDWLNTYAYR